MKQRRKLSKGQKAVVVALLVVGAVLLLGDRGEEPVAQAGTETDACGPTDLVERIGQYLPGNPTGILECLGTAGAGGAGMQAYIQFDGSAYTLVGQPHADPTAQGPDAKCVCYGTTGFSVEWMSQGLVVHRMEFTRGEAALLTVDFVDQAGTEELRIIDAQAGTQVVVLQ